MQDLLSSEAFKNFTSLFNPILPFSYLLLSLCGFHAELLKAQTRQHLRL